MNSHGSPLACLKVQAKLIVVYTHTGQTAELVAKYRPPMPILTMVVPHLISDGLKWKLDGRWEGCCKYKLSL